MIRDNRASTCPENLAQLRECAASRPDVVILDAPLSRQEVFSWKTACDAYVSLQRSEGFGLNLAESMLLGKSVIATNWSGTSISWINSCPVDFTLVQLNKDYGPYRKGYVWADPDLDQAASYMRSLLKDRGSCQALGERARIAADYSPAVIGNRYRRRLQMIQRFNATGHRPPGL